MPDATASRGPNTTTAAASTSTIKSVLFAVSFLTKLAAVYLGALVAGRRA